MAREHLSSLAVEAGVLQRVLAPILVSVGGNAVRSRAAADRSSWQSAAEDLARAAHRVDALLPVVLGAAPATAAGEPSPTELLSALSDLQNIAEQTRKLLAP